jgi:hypothetical protein
MSKTIEDILTRRSIRHFRPDPVPEELLEQIVNAGLYAPSAKNHQSSVILAVTDPALIARLSEANRIIWGKPEGTDPFFGAPAVLVVLDRADWRNRVYDGSLVMANLMLAAHALGLGSCWVHRAKEEFEMPEFRELLSSLGLEGEYEGIGHCVIGWPAEEQKEALPRKDGRAIYIKG